jgi:pyruvate,orthophosphate dikinase
MSALGLSVPPGLTITTEVCALYNKVNGKIPSEVWSSILEGLHTLEQDTGRRFGDSSRPLLVSARSGAAVSMPGMMDTVLNLGLNDETVLGLAANGKDRFAYDSYRRFLTMFGDVVLGIPHTAFEAEMNNLKTRVGVTQDNNLNEDHLRDLVQMYKQVYKTHGQVFPEDPLDQLEAAISAVFNSWMSERAIKYREAEAITGSALRRICAFSTLDLRYA